MSRSRAARRKPSIGKPSRSAKPAGQAVLPPAVSHAEPVQPTVLLTSRGGPFQGVGAATLRRRAAKMLSYLGLKGVELSIALVDDATMTALNGRYRHKNRPTDVLSFPMHEWGGRQRRSASGERIGAEWPHAGPLGDIVVSIETARRQAEDRRRTLLAELTMLLAHGLLHLLGYDHRTDAEEREMLALTHALENAAGARHGRVSRDDS